MNTMLTKIARVACSYTGRCLAGWAAWTALCGAGFAVMAPPGEAERAAIALGATVPGHPLLTLILLSAELGLTIGLVMAIGATVFGTTWSSIRTVALACNGSPREPARDVATVAASSVVLTGLLALYGFHIPLFAAWEVLLLAGVLAGTWRLARRTAADPFFDAEATASLKLAAEHGKPLALATLVVLAGVLGWSFRIADLPAPWPVTLAVAASGVLVALALPVERHVREALSIAKHNRIVRRIRSREPRP